MPRAGLSLLCLLGCLVSAACAHYRLGQNGTPPFASIYVEPVVNHTKLPQSQAVIDTQIRNAFLQDGRVAIAASPEAADAVLHVELQGYERNIVSFRADDTGLARQLTLNLRVDCSLADRRTGKLLFDRRPVIASQDVYTDSGQQQSEYQALPLLAASLAGKITHTVLDVW